MAKKGKRDTIIEALLERGLVEVPSRSKYRQFKAPESNEESYIFVGQNGAVRTGRIASKSRSITRSKWVQEFLLEKWEK